MSERPWIDRQLRRRGISDERVLAAMARVPRELFVPAEFREIAYDDAPVPLPHGQFLSQPYMVALTCQSLGLTGSERVLDVGTGSGYAAAVLAELAAEVYSIERIAALAEAARASLDAAGYGQVTVEVGDGALGLAEHAPYDGIAVAAAAAAVPRPLWDELAPGGRIVLPLRTERGTQRLCTLERAPGGPRLLGTTSAVYVPLLPGVDRSGV